jgi:hypothetical protein
MIVQDRTFLTTRMAAWFDPPLASLAAGPDMPAWRSLALVAFFVAALISIVVGLGLQIWIPALQLRRFSRVFAGRPEAAEAFSRVFDNYGWRARLACRLFHIALPPGVKGANTDS